MHTGILEEHTAYIFRVKAALLAACPSTFSGLLVMMNELERIQKESVMIASVPAEIQTEQLRNTSLEHYYYANRFYCYVNM
jgi:hypothetical protein